jgi:plasmid replication initiation protein
MERLPSPEPRRNQDALREPKARDANLSGQRRTARAFDRQVAEFQIRDTVLKGFTAPGIPVTQVAG